MPRRAAPAMMSIVSAYFNAIDCELLGPPASIDEIVHVCHALARRDDHRRSHIFSLSPRYEHQRRALMFRRPVYSLYAALNVFMSQV